MTSYETRTHIEKLLKAGNTKRNEMKKRPGQMSLNPETSSTNVNDVSAPHLVGTPYTVLKYWYHKETSLKNLHNEKEIQIKN